MSEDKSEDGQGADAIPQLNPKSKTCFMTD